MWVQELLEEGAYVTWLSPLQELLEELVCVRLDQDFQLHKLEITNNGGGGGGGGGKSLPTQDGGGSGSGGGGGGGGGLSLRDEQTYFLSHGLQIQRITFVQQAQEAPGQIARGALSSVSRWAKPAPVHALGSRREPEISFSEIKVRRDIPRSHQISPDFTRSHQISPDRFLSRAVPTACSLTHTHPGLQLHLQLPAADVLQGSSPARPPCDPVHPQVTRQLRHAHAQLGGPSLGHGYHYQV